MQALFIPPLDLHVLGTPPAFILSHDQTLKFVVLIRLLCLRLPLPATIRLRRPRRAPGTVAGASPIPWGFAMQHVPKLPLGSAGCCKASFFGGLVPASGSLIFRGYSVFKGQPSLKAKPHGPCARSNAALYVRAVLLVGSHHFLPSAPQREANAIISIPRILSRGFLKNFSVSNQLKIIVTAQKHPLCLQIFLYRLHI